MKGMKTSFSTSSIDWRPLDQVGPDAPVLLGRVEDLVVDPAAVRRLQQRVVEEEQEPPAGLEHPGDLGDGLVDVVDVLEHQAGDTASKLASGNGRAAAPERA
jgi:hypothetical protein